MAAAVLNHEPQQCLLWGLAAPLEAGSVLQRPLKWPRLSGPSLGRPVSLRGRGGACGHA